MIVYKLIMSLISAQKVQNILEDRDANGVQGSWSVVAKNVHRVHGNTFTALDYNNKPYTVTVSIIPCKNGRQLLCVKSSI